MKVSRFTLFPVCFRKKYYKLREEIVLPDLTFVVLFLSFLVIAGYQPANFRIAVRTGPVTSLYVINAEPAGFPSNANTVFHSE